MISVSRRFFKCLQSFGVAYGMLGVLAGPLFAQSPQKPFQREDIAIIAGQIEDRLKREVTLPPNSDAARLIRDADAALGRNAARAALPLANLAVLAQPQNPAAWRVLSRVARAIEPRDWRERNDMQERTLAAAYIAYQRSRTKREEALSLFQLAEIFESREQWRPALTTYRIGLEAEDNTEKRDAYEKLRAERGFRVSGNETDADSANPRACFTFSEPLARGRTDFAPFVAITGRGDFSVSADDKQICVDGLRHGERYAVVLRQGIPSAVDGEVLLKSADYDIYVRDRRPSVRASGKTYVLPRTGQQGIPLTSVNTQSLGIRVLRIGDRNLISTLRGGGFLDQMETYQLRIILEESGQQVWQGSMDVKPELNKDVVTAFPVQEAAGKLEPGVYLLVAQPGAVKPITPNSDDYESEKPASQWFVVSDLGLTAFSGSEGVGVLVRSLADAKPVADAEVRLLARNNEILGTVKSDRNGLAQFPAGLARGTGGLAPGLASVEAKGDFGFLDLQQSAFDLSDRGVSGRIAPKGLDAFIYAERGVYRPGESVHVTTLLRDARGAAVTGLPLTLLVRRPDGVEYRKSLVDDQGAGGRALSVPLVGTAPTGTWRILAYADPKAQAIGEASFLVEDYQPERLEMVVSSSAKTLKSGADAEVDIALRYLYGAPAADLTISGEMIVRAATESAIPGFAGFRVGIAEETTLDPVRTPIEAKATTDAQGKAKLSTSITEPETTLPLEAEIILTASESGGRGINRSITLPIIPKGAALGIKPFFGEDELTDGAEARFGLILATGEGKRLARNGVKWQLSRINRNFQWYYRDGRWAYEAIRTTRRVADGDITVSETTVAEISAKIGFGTWRIEARAPGTDGAETAFEFTVGYAASAKVDTPDMLDLVLDKKSYAAGETMQIRLSPRMAGTATLAVMTDRIAHMLVVDIPAEGRTIPLPVEAEWGAGAYLVALHHRPLDSAAKRMPSRAMGLSWFGIGEAQRKIGVEIAAAPVVRPRGTLDVPIKLTNLAPGEETFLTLAAVDVGILSLTGYQAPDAGKFFFGQRQLSSDLRDLYGYLIDGMQGTRGAIRSGGDAAPDLKGDRPTEEPLARYSGVVKAGPDGTARISFDLPAFNGSVKLMAVAWSKSRAGSSSKDVIVRDPVVLQATVPRFLSLGDRSRIAIEINNVEAETGTYVLDVDLKGPASLTPDASMSALRLEKGKKLQLSLPLRAAGIGTAELSLALSGPAGNFTQGLRIPLQSSATNLAQRIIRPLPPGQSLTLSADLLAEYVPGSGALGISASPYAAIDVANLLASLDRYPYGCTEQTVSRAMPLLYLNRLASLEGLGLDGDAPSRISAAIDRVLSRQGANGAFGLWGVGGEDLWLDAFTVDFLTRAREEKIDVPQTGFMLALDRLRNQVSNTGELRPEEGPALAYALYVLARNGRAVTGDLRYLVDNRLADFKTPLAQGQLGAALAMTGDRARAKTAFDAARSSLASARDDGNWRVDYGSSLRDGAGLLALLAETNAAPSEIAAVANLVDSARGGAKYLSTQDQTYLVLAATALAKEKATMQLAINGQAHQGIYNRRVSGSALTASPVIIRNDGQSDAKIVLSTSGIPLQPEPAFSAGYAVERSYFTLSGKPVAPKEFKQNERYLVKLMVRETPARKARMLVVDPLPAGLQIENPALTKGASTEEFGFVGKMEAPVHSEARDDRFVAAFDREASAKEPLIVAYIVRAVTPGRYTHPAAFAEDMYRPERFGRTAYSEIEIAAAGSRP